jgi:hypothetical protein
MFFARPIGTAEANSYASGGRESISKQLRIRGKVRGRLSSATAQRREYPRLVLREAEVAQRTHDAIAVLQRRLHNNVAHVSHSLYDSFCQLLIAPNHLRLSHSSIGAFVKLKAKIALLLMAILPLSGMLALA